MKKILQWTVAWLLLATLNHHLATTNAQGTTFTYQGRLADNGQSANGNYGMVFYLCDNPTNGGQLANLGIGSVPVTNGLFIVSLNFGTGMFPGADRWLEITVKTNGAAVFTTLVPRQKIAPTPYAITASNLSGTLPAVQVSGQLAGSQIANGAVGVAQIDNTAVQARINGTAPLGQFITGIAANGNITTAADTTDWKLGGNNVLPGQFLGSTNNQMMAIKVNSLLALQISPTPNDATHSNLVNLAGGSPVNFMAPGVYGSVIAGGGAGYYYDGAHTNSMFADMSFIGGGGGNSVSQNAGYSFVGGGINNSIGTNSGTSFVGGGYNNTIYPNASSSFIGGGNFNFINSSGGNSLIGGGYANHILTAVNASSIVGGFENEIQSNTWSSFIGGGEYNAISNVVDATIGGGSQNSVTADYGTIGGGYFNGVYATNGTIAGGYGNRIDPSLGDATVGGGRNNVVGSEGGVIAGGIQSHIINFSSSAAIGGGYQNFIEQSGSFGTIAGGTFNFLTASFATIGGGYFNTNSGTYATVPGGRYNLAGGQYSFAAGQQAQALNQGSFVWSDSQNATFSSTANNQFLIRAGGNVGINTNNPSSTLQVNGQIAATSLRSPGAGINSSTYAFTQRVVSTNTSGNVTTIYNSITDNDPNAILIITPYWTADTNSTSKYNSTPVGVFYNSPHWAIFNEDGSIMALGRAFNVLVIKP